MQMFKILTPLIAVAAMALAPSFAQTQNPGDSVLLEMQQASRKADKAKLSQLLPLARGHVLEPWAAYWELRARLSDAMPSEVNAFLQRYAGSYQEDRLRNDWLLQLGQRRDWLAFAEQHPQFRMSDDREVRCYALAIETIQGRATESTVADVTSNWYALRESDDGCTTAASELFAAKKMRAQDIWIKARLGAEANRSRVVRNAVTIVAPDVLTQVSRALESPAKYLQNPALRGRANQEVALLALIRIAASDPAVAAAQLEGSWSSQLTSEEVNWAWGVMGKVSAQRLSPDAVGYFGRVRKNSDLNDDMLGWKVRAALRASDWKMATEAISAMSEEARKDSTWVYWQAKALLQGRTSQAERERAQQMFEVIASTRGFYEQLAMEELGQRITVPPAPAPLTLDEKAMARANPSLVRGMYAIQMGLRTEGVREWNYATNLHQPGGMPERELLAAADWACQQAIWDRCINTSERTRTVQDWSQRFPMPFHDTVLARSRLIGLDPAYVYGLIRQESRFIMDARSGVGASGLMQVMPATATWTAKKIGMTDFRPNQITDRDVNITIGTAYLKLALDDFDGSMALAAAAYNAGPGRPRNWRNGPVLDAAIWAENVPFAETRDYVKKVLSNTTNYAAIITGQPQSLRARLGAVGPRPVAEPEPNKDLP